MNKNMKPITDTELDALLVAVHDGTQGSYSENLRAGVDKLLEQRAAEATSEVTDEDVGSALDAWELALEPRGKPYKTPMRAAAEALAKRWSQPALDPVVTERLGKIIEESKE